jgi:hypothetical protein
VSSVEKKETIDLYIFSDSGWGCRRSIMVFNTTFNNISVNLERRK